MVARVFVSLVVSMALAACTSEIVTWEEPPESDNPSRPDDDEGQGRRDGDEGGDDGGERDDDEDEDDEGDDEDGFQPGSPGQEVSGIPAGQMPPPGRCRIWHPDRPPGQQPPSGDCATLRDRVPEDAWLLYRPTQEARVYRIA